MRNKWDTRHMTNEERLRHYWDEYERNHPRAWMTGWGWALYIILGLFAVFLLPGDGH